MRDDWARVFTGKSLQDPSLLDHRELLGLPQVSRMNRERVDEFIQLLGHALVERDQLLEMAFDRCPLIGGLP